MIQQELGQLKEAESKARELLQQAGIESRQILAQAQAEAKNRHQQAVRQAHKQGRGDVDQTAKQFAENRETCLNQYNDRLQLLKQAAAGRRDEAAAKIFEGMWSNGNCTDDQFQPDDA